MNDDLQLVQSAVSGVTSAFETLVRRYQDRLYNSLVHVTGNPHEAEEVVQEAMLKAYSKLASFRGQSGFYTWLYRIAWNTAISRQRKRRPRVSLDQMQQQLGDEPTDEQAGPMETLQQAEQVQQVHAALGQLSDDYRAVLVLREIDGCDYEEISDALQVPVGTVRSRLHRARAALRQVLKETLEELGGT